MLSCDIRKVMAAALVLTTTFITMPVSAADFSAARPVIGSVSAVGAVDLRGVGISQEGTLFAGDSVRSHEKGYAKVLLGTGSKIELYEKTDVTLNSDAKGVKIAMNSGNLGFTAKSDLRVDVAPFEVIASDNASGNVAVISPTTAGVRAINGKVTVKNLKTSESFVLLKGQEQLLGLVQGTHTKPLGQVASNVPTVPAPGAPQTPASSSLAIDTGTWLAIAGAAGLASISIWALVAAHNNNNDINSLRTQVTSLNGTITSNQTTAAAQIVALQNAEAVQANLAAQQAALAQVTANAQAALNALFASGQASTSQAAALQAVISAAATQQGAIAGLQGAASTCIAAIGTCNTSSLFTSASNSTASTNTIVGQGNSANNNAHTLNSNAPSGNTQTVSGPAQSSQTTPH